MLPVCEIEGRLEAGVDEAGRGCLAGPVFAAAVILPDGYINPVLNDSKQLSEKTRYALREQIIADAIAWAVGICDHKEIDKINILNASILAMHRALDKLTVRPGAVSVDGNRFKPYRDILCRTFVKGDGRFANIAAASILAKTFRDDYMLGLHEKFPQYGWDRNKGYPTQAHRRAIEQFGPSPFHRLSFTLINPQLTLF